MAADKKTFIRNAQKQVQKGQIDRAITTYRAILKMDPNDVKVHNTLGDLYIRKSQKKEGIGEYLWVADYYEKDGFLLRSIAICQKILNLDGEMVDVRLKLADLYVQQRLAAEAKKQYLLVADHYEKKGKVAEALEAFSKLADLDPGNLQIRIKLGSNYEKQDMPNKAAREYAMAAEGLVKAGKPDRAAELLDKALEISPDNIPARRAKADLHAYREEWDDVAATLAPIAAGEEADVQVLKTYAGACLKTGKVPDAIESLEKAKEAEPTSFPLQTLLGRAYIEGKEFDKARTLYAPIVENFIKEEKLEAAEDLVRQLAAADASHTETLHRLLNILERKGDSEGMAATHASLAAIFEAQGDEKEALASFEKVLGINPDDASAAESIARLRGGMEGAAAEPAEPTVSAEPVTDDQAEAGMVDLKAVDLPDTPEVAVGEGSVPEAGASDLEGDEEEILIDEEDVEITLEDEGEEVEFVLDDEAAEEPAGEPLVEEPPVAAEPAAPVEEELQLEEADIFSEAGADGEMPVDDIEVVDLDQADEDFLAGTAAVEETESPEEEGDTDAIDLSAVVEAEIGDLEEPDATAEALRALEKEAAEVEAGPRPDEMPAAQDEEDVGGADFFDSDEVASLVEEGVLDEDPAVAEERAAAEAPAEEPTSSIPEELAADEGLDLDVEALGDIDAVEDAAETATVSSENEELEEFLAEADFYMQQGLTDEAEFLYQKLAKLAPDNAEVAERLQRLQGGKEDSAGKTAAEPLIPQDEISALESDLDRVLGGDQKPPEALEGSMKLTVADDGGSGDTSEFSDFLTDLKGEFEEDVPEPAPAASDEESLSAIFQEFQEGLKEQLGEEDFETHYNLGIAYKEMGLMQEALGEFNLSEKSQVRQMDSISMIALCLKEMGSVDEALAKLEEGLTIVEEGSDEQKGFKYDIAELLSQQGRQGEAMEIFIELHELYPDYRDVAERVGKGSPASPPAGDDREVSDDSPSEQSNSRVSYL